ncbi:acyl-CoA thioesterase-1 [Pseudooceanicola antarcticus]|uniref:Acyl-CoA thioesterase-1 n=2 Tax=Pseudooceanicola antarcticus TaxID=1247613 RepID=A0A285IH26_9RHOB|nr:arylesterase [Pseudooceanicola antarcticus]SNY47269.1 acyl-CoA thioesterase-1 [Pseudooceanicola antarcticus]
MRSISPLLAGLMALLLVLPAGVRAEVRLLAFGDSLVQGYGLPQGEGFVPQLEARLRDGGHEVSVINAGVSGDTSAGGLSRIGWSLAEDVDAVIVVLGGNDLLRGLDPGDTRENIGGILEEIRARGLPVLLAGMQAPGNYGAAYKEAFDGLYPALAEANGARLFPSFMAPLMGDPEAPDLAAARALLQPDGVHPNAEGVARIVEAMLPQVEAMLAEVE